MRLLPSVSLPAASGWLLIAALPLAGCDSPITNVVFLEDAEFLGALPGRDRHTVVFPGLEEDDSAAVMALTAPLPDEEAPDLLQQTTEIAAGLNTTLSDMMVLGDWVRSEEPSMREDDLRSWGPISLENGTRTLLLVDVIRSGLGQYDWAFQLSESSGGPWDAFYQGPHYAGATVSEGDGSFSADLGLLSEHLGEQRQGTVSVVYDHRDGTSLQVSIDGYRDLPTDPAIDSGYRYSLDPESRGDFQYGAADDLVAGEALESVGVRARWKSAGDMRIDQRLQGGDMGGEVFTLSQCWDAGGVLVFQEDSAGLYEVLGDERDCPYGKPSYAEDW